MKLHAWRCMIHEEVFRLESHFPYPREPGRVAVCLRALPRKERPSRTRLSRSWLLGGAHHTRGHGIESRPKKKTPTVEELRKLIDRALYLIDPMAISHLPAGTEWRKDAEVWIRDALPIVFPKKTCPWVTTGYRTSRLLIS